MFGFHVLYQIKSEKSELSMLNWLTGTHYLQSGEAYQVILNLKTACLKTKQEAMGHKQLLYLLRH